MTFLDRGTHPNKVKYYGCIRIDIKKAAGTIARLILFCHRLESTEAKKKKSWKKIWEQLCRSKRLASTVYAFISSLLSFQICLSHT